MADPVYRDATPADRRELVALLDRTFDQRGFAHSFGEQFPHLFTDQAIGSHRIALIDGKILGCVGAYRFRATLHGSPITVAGVGQVATAPEAQGRGLMTRLLDEALQAANDVDLWWLYGDRQRYGRVGFAVGGEVVEGLTWDRYTAGIPTAGPEIRVLDRARDDALIAAALAARPFALKQDARERALMLDGKGASGLSDGAALILTDRDRRRVWAMHGEAGALGRLIAHQVESHRRAKPDDSGMRIEADPGDPPALAVVRRVSGNITTLKTASFRLGRLRPVLQAWASAHPPPPGARLQPASIDGGAVGAVRIACADGAWSISDHRGAADVRLQGAELNELIFGIVPVAGWSFPRDSVLNYLLPLHFAVPGCYAL
jgi:predicted N-acetyltransferase YhbS